MYIPASTISFYRLFISDRGEGAGDHISDSSADWLVSARFILAAVTLLAAVNQTSLRG